MSMPPNAPHYTRLCTARAEAVLGDTPCSIPQNPRAD